ncbi:MAG: carboxypeptidase regulatory-like domain-containing protein [Lewinellaceae bacterium]|nr:carboxypeptidase regulatory-like domain-containing protein [Lewinellaceae bacterium]
MKARNHLLVADEVSNGFVSVWDLSNLDDVRQTSRFRPKGLSGSIPHNAFILDNYAFVSWYRDGVMMLDLNRPENIVQVGQFDTSPLSGNGFNGSWGNYPYLKSGNILVSDIENGLFVFTPTYVRACYLEGSVKDARTKKPVVGAVVYILQGDQADMPVTSTQGNYQTGQALSGKFRVLIYHEDYRPGLQTVQLKNGEVTMLNIELTPLSEPGEEVSLLLLKAEDHQPLSGMEFVVRNEIFQFICRTDAKGWAKIPIVYADTFDLFPSTWGRMPLKNVIIDPVQLHPLMLDRGYYDDFYFNFGWISGGDANGGFWERGKLQKYQSFIPAPNTDISNDLGDTCFLTDHRISYGDIWFDVTGGTVSLTSPPVDLQNFKYPVLQFQYWLTISDTSSQFFVSLENTQTGIKKKVWESNANVLFWTSSGAIPLPAITKEGIWNIVFEARDTTTGLGQGLLEVGIDEIIIREAEPLAPYPIENFSADVFPNPFYDHLILRCFLPEKQIPAEWHLFNAVGSLVMSGNIRNSISVLTLTPGISSGVYFLSIQQAGRVLKTIKIIHY